MINDGGNWQKCYLFSKIVDIIRTCELVLGEGGSGLTPPPHLISEYAPEVIR